MSVVLDFNSVETFTTSQIAKGNDVRWDGWTLVFFKKNPYKGFTSRTGAFRKGTWGIETRVPVDSSGKWRVPYNNVKHS